jgi:S-adenosylmethionine:tRNA ribosyltransferase-isomerase
MAAAADGIARGNPLRLAAMFRPADYWFDLPPAQIAQAPSAVRDASRLLVVGQGGALSDRQFPDIVDALPADAVIIANDTKVIPARVFGVRPTGGAVELLFLEPVTISGSGSGSESASGSVWRCLAKASGPLRPGQTLAVGDVTLTIAAERGPDGSLALSIPCDPLAFLEAHGQLPLPHYIDRAPGDDDRDRYQTMFARDPGAVAAPTAGLHMTPAIAARLAARGITLATLTLHVGWGTFAPIRVDDVRQHRMHEERYTISEETAALIASGRPIVALGTTALRALESAAIAPGQVATGSGRTSLFIYPGSDHRFQIASHLITNFHLPESTLLMLVCAFAGPSGSQTGTERILAAYRHAVAAGYRFFSYGDAMLVTRQP